MANEFSKQYAGEWAARYVESGMVVGLGTGSTVFYTIDKLGALVQQGLRISAVASSDRTEALARERNIPIASFDDITSIDITIDGADEVDQHNNLIKGGGGAHTREKILIHNTKKFIVVADSSKCVEVLGKFPLPVEILPFGAPLTLKNLAALGCEPALRTTNGTTYVTENGNFTADCRFSRIEQPSDLDRSIRAIAGVVETGLVHRSHVAMVIVGYGNGMVKEIKT